MQQPATGGGQLGDDIVLSPEHREAIRSNGVITTPNRKLSIDGEFVHVEVTGDSDLPVIIFDCRVFEEVLRLHKRVFVLLYDPRGGQTMPANCRRWVAEWDRQHGVNAVAVVNNGSRGTNTMLSLLVRGMNLVRRKPMKLAFYATQTEARAWLDELRHGPSQRSD